MNIKQRKVVEVVAGIVIFNDTVLCTQKGVNKYDYISHTFEFPGGKIEQGETKKEALRRELIEELNIEPIIKKLYISTIHQYPDFVQAYFPNQYFQHDFVYTKYKTQGV